MKNMKKFKIAIIIIILMILLIILGLIVLNNKNVNNTIQDDYIAIFHGGVGEITYEKYIYKIDNGQDNYGFKYINITNTTESWGSTNWTYKITDKGTFNWTDEAFIIAKKMELIHTLQYPMMIKYIP